ncbi:FAD binding domain-containing protein [Rutstroemia sp. NJR-2017a WRK4]|nr:FAD binding domain-containing protein [Rutstroemia sp. NJR-2017a WRK4]
MFGLKCAIVVLGFLSLGYGAPSMDYQTKPKCRYLPSDPEWPTQATWRQLNQTVGGRLIPGVPLGRPCYEPQLDTTECSQIQDEYLWPSSYETNPVNVMSPYWLNNSCSPFLGPNGSCTLGNLASYALNVSGPADVIAGLEFVRKNNMRLTIKNTGHDFLGRSTGAGSLGLWMHNLDEITFLDYSSPFYTGPSYRIGAGVGYNNLYPVASADGYRVVGGSCPTVGVTGGFTQGGGHGPLGSAYGLGADQVLEWEVVTAAGKHMSVSPVHEADLYWALSGGGAGNFAVVLSMTVRAYVDGPVAGASFSFVNSGNDTAYWAGVSAWVETLLVLDTIEGFMTGWGATDKALSLIFATLPDATTTEKIDTALAPFFHELEQLNISVMDSYQSTVHATFAEHYAFWAPTAYTSNISIASRLIPRSTVRDKTTSLPSLIASFRSITTSGGLISAVSSNFTSPPHIPNSVLPSWRSALFIATFESPMDQTANWEAIRQNQVLLNTWQEQLRNITPGGGSYMNEVTWDNPYWKEDNYGENYAALLAVKEKWDPEFVFWANAAVGSDVYWEVDGRGALCRV